MGGYQYVRECVMTPYHNVIHFLVTVNEEGNPVPVPPFTGTGDVLHPPNSVRYFNRGPVVNILMKIHVCILPG